MLPSALPAAALPAEGALGPLPPSSQALRPPRRLAPACSCSGEEDVGTVGAADPLLWHHDGCENVHRSLLSETPEGVGEARGCGGRETEIWLEIRSPEDWRIERPGRERRGWVAEESGPGGLG